MDQLKNVGVAISTTPKRKKVWDKLKENFKEFMPEDAIFDFRVDEKYKGVAFSKNASLRKLYDAGCENFYLFDDDVWLKRKGFFHWVYRVHKASDIHHFCYMNTNLKHHKELQALQFGNHRVQITNGLSGCFLYLTREALDRAGGYDLDFKGYGYNHIEFTGRINAHFNRQPNHYTTIKDMDKFLHSQDFDGPVKGIRKTQTLTRKQKQPHIERNKAIFDEKRKNLLRKVEF